MTEPIKPRRRLTPRPGAVPSDQAEEVKRMRKAFEGLDELAERMARIGEERTTPEPAPLPAEGSR